MSTLLTDNNAAIIQHGFGKPFADLIASICTTIDTLGGDGTGVFSTSVTSPTFQSDAGTADFLLNSDGDDAQLLLTGDGTTKLQFIAGAASARIISTAATGEYSEVLTANLADAKSVTDGTNDLLVFITTTSALAITVPVALVSTPPVNQTLTNSATITLPVGINKVVDNGGAVTGIIMTAGLYDGQIVNVINAAAASVTFATAGTSNVADGTSAVIAANRAVSLIYDSGSSLWYRTG